MKQVFYTIKLTNMGTKRDIFKTLEVNATMVFNTEKIASQSIISSIFLVSGV
jgi:hypothetical protein